MKKWEPEVKKLNTMRAPTAHYAQLESKLHEAAKNIKYEPIEYIRIAGSNEYSDRMSSMRDSQYSGELENSGPFNSLLDQFTDPMAWFDDPRYVRIGEQDLGEYGSKEELLSTYKDAGDIEVRKPTDALEDLFKANLDNSVISRKMSQLFYSDGSLDAERTIENAAYHIAAYRALHEEAFAGSEDYESTKALLEEELAQGLSEMADKLAGGMSEYLSKGGAVDTESLSLAIETFATERVSAYKELFDNGSVSTAHTADSVQAYLYSKQERLGGSTVETQFGALSYEDLSKVSDAISSFEKSLANQKKDFMFYHSAEEAGMRLGMAKTQVRLMNDGSELYKAFAKAADARIEEEKQWLAESNRQYKANSFSSGASYYFSALDLSKVDKYIKMFDDLDFGNLSQSMQRVMDKIANQFVNHAINDESYGSSSAKSNDSYFRDMPDEFWQDRATIARETRKMHISSAQNYLMASWNEWLGTSANVRNQERFMLSSSYNSIDYSV